MTKKGCVLCGNFRQTRAGPQYLELECQVQSAEFNHAENCASYAPLQLPGVGPESSGYVWDVEFEGAA